MDQEKISNLLVASYNCRGLRKEDLGLNNLLSSNHITLLQETWLSKTDCKNIGTLFPNFNGVADSPNDDSENILVGRQNKREGVAILWHSSLHKYIKKNKF